MNIIQKLGIGAIGLAGLVRNSDAQITGNIEIIKSLKGDRTEMIRPNLFYEISEIEGDVYTWHEFYENGSHAGRTAFNMPVKGVLSFRSDITYGSNKKADEGFGVQISKSFPSGVFGEIYVLNFNEEKKLVGYYINTKLGPVTFSSFNEWNIADGIKQDYGEINAEIPLINNYSAEINTMLTQGENEGLTITPETRIMIKRLF